MIIDILWLHGFGGSGDSQSVKAMRKALGPEFKITAPDLDFSNPPEIDRVIFEAYVGLGGETDPIIVGNSLGGFFANSFGTSNNLPTILINPSLHPTMTVAKRDDVPEEMKRAYARREQVFEDLYTRRRTAKLVIIGGADDVVDPNKNGRLLTGCQIVEIPDMGHVISAKYKEIAGLITGFANQVYG